MRSSLQYVIICCIFTMVLMLTFYSSDAPTIQHDPTSSYKIRKTNVDETRSNHTRKIQSIGALNTAAVNEPLVHTPAPGTLEHTQGSGTLVNTPATGTLEHTQGSGTLVNTPATGTLELTQGSGTFVNESVRGLIANSTDKKVRFDTMNKGVFVNILGNRIFVKTSVNGVLVNTSSNGLVEVTLNNRRIANVSGNGVFVNVTGRVMLVDQSNNGTLLNASGKGMVDTCNATDKQVHVNGSENGLLSNVSYLYINKILEDCGELCNTTRNGTKGLYFDETTANINCETIFKNNYIDAGNNQTNATKEIPKHLLKYFTMQGRIEILKSYHNQRYFGKKAKSSVWLKESINSLIMSARRGLLSGPYGPFETQLLRDGLRRSPGIINGRVLVIGSESPWAEVCVLEAGAREVVTLEYGRINCTHPSIKTMVPGEFRQRFLNKTLGLFDAVVTFSSVEHSGLGRYGDALNPWGDIIAIARGWCVTKRNGGLVLGVPFELKRDHVVFNAHRVYGRLRFPYLTTNWKQVYMGKKSVQRVFVFRRG